MHLPLFHFYQKYRLIIAIISIIIEVLPYTISYLTSRLKYLYQGNMNSSFLRILLPFVMAIVPFSVSASEPEETLVLELADGTKEYFFLSDKPVIIFDGETLKFKTDDFSTDLENIVSFRFKDVDRELVTSINTLKAEKQVTITYTNDKSFMIHGISISDVRVFTSDGRIAKAEISKLEGGVSINLESLKSGIYIIKTNKQSFKINKK